MNPIKYWGFLMLLVVVVWGLVKAFAQVPPAPQEPLVIRETRMRTNVAVKLVTTISEIQGIKVDDQFIALRTNVAFRFETNVWWN